MQILIATHNQAKLKRYKNILSTMNDIELVSLNDLNITDKVDENHLTSVENALKKSRIYGDLSVIITIGIDEALMTNFLPDNEQPGVFARRFTNDKTELTDQGVIDTWKKIFAAYPQPDKQFIWDFAVAYYNTANKSDGVGRVQQISYVASHFSEKLQPGYPMSSFMSPYPNGAPYTELSQTEKDAVDTKNFVSFVNQFQIWLSQQQ
jgi:hypothetical protein